MDYFGYVVVGWALFWVGGGEWGCMGYNFGWVGVSGVEWGIILGGVGWVGEYFG